jgi:hypothetical protein
MTRFGSTNPSPIRIFLIAAGLAALAAAGFAATQTSRPPAVIPPDPKAGAPSGPIVSKSQLPPNTLAALTEICGNCRIADSNEEWNSTDVVLAGLPDRRFTSIAQTKDHWEIGYERGGYVTSSYSLLLSNEAAPQVLPGSTCSSAPRYECRW